MSLRKRTTKLVAKRHDLNYFKRMSRVRAWQWWLAAGALVAAMVWFSASTITHGAAVLSAWPMSSSHAVIGERCELCHVPVIAATRFTPGFGMRRHVPDAACLQCHVAAAHHPTAVAAMATTKTPTCASCHTEHVGAMHLAAVADSGCTQCHARLESRSGVLKVAASVTSFASGHPEFEPLQKASDAEKKAATALAFNHAEHMRAGLKGPTGPVTLECATCHAATLRADSRQGNGMQPVSFEKSCRSCHSLGFDVHVQAEAPHKSPTEVDAFVRASLTQFAEQHPQVVSDEIKHWPMQQAVPGMMQMAAPKNEQQWVQVSVMRAETILWRERCGLCHKADAGIPSDGSLPVYQVVAQPQRWLPDAVFSHPAHGAVACAECHVKALSDGGEHEVLMPSIETCRRCHDGRSSPQGPALASGHAESGCFLCHVYHGPETAALTVKGLALEQLGRP